MSFELATEKQETAPWERRLGVLLCNQGVTAR